MVQNVEKKTLRIKVKISLLLDVVTINFILFQGAAGQLMEVNNSVHALWSELAGGKGNQTN